MAFWSNLLSWSASTGMNGPRAAVQGGDGGVTITSSAELAEHMRFGTVSASGQAVTPSTSLRNPTTYGCVRLIAGAVANLPLYVNRRIDHMTRLEASDSPLWRLLRRKPNRWQTPSQFKRYMQTNLLLRGNAYALKVMSRGQVIELIPLHPDKVECKQNADLTLSYTYMRANGQTVTLSQEDIFHMVGLTLDGIHGVSVLTFAREAIGEALSMTDHGAKLFKNAARPSGMLKHPAKLGKEGMDNLRASLEEFKSGESKDAATLLLEEGMDFAVISMTSVDAQWIESRKFSRTDIAMFFGVPPHMLGNMEGMTNSGTGTGLEQQSGGFVAYTLEDWLTTWEESIARDMIPESDPDLYVRFNRAALVKGDIKTRWEAYVKGLQWGVYSPNEVRALEDENPREGGDVYYDPPNTAGMSAADPTGAKP